MALQIPVTAGFVAIDTGTPKTITVPLSTDRLGRILTFKDRTGQAATNNITLQTQGSDVFDNGATTYKIDQPYGTVTVISRSGQWLIQVGYERVYVSTIQANYFIGNGSLLTALPAGAVLSTNLTSTVQGLGSANYVSTLSLVSTTQGLQNSYATAGFLSTANLTSTVQGLGSANYVSTLSLVSTTQGLQNSYATAGFLSTANLTSTVAGLGTAGYLSTTALGPFFSSMSTSYALNFITSSLTFSTATGSNATISSVTANQFTVGTNGGWLLTGALQTAILSSIQINTNLLYANSNFFGTVSSQTALQFYGLQGNYNNTVIAEQSTGTGTQELLLFKGSSASDQVRIQTTGGFRLETGVSSRLWPTYAQAANPALYVDINSNVGIGTASPGALLDVVGQGRFQVVSTLQLNISSINGATFGSPINSTVIGLGSAGYVSTLSLVSTTAGILANISITGVLSTANLTSTVQGLGSANYVSTLSLVSTTAGILNNISITGVLSTANLTSTVQGLGSANYVSTLSLVSTTQGLQTGYATAGFLSTPNLTSTVQGLGSANYVSTLSLVSTTQGLQTGYATAGFLSTPNLTSTVQGLGSAGYISSSQLISTVAGLNTYASSFIDTAELNSTVQGLGSANYISSSQLISTTQGLTTYISSFIDPTELASTVIGLGTAGFVSSIGLDARLTSTTQGLGSAGYISSSQLISTVAGLNTYASSFIDVAELTSSINSLGTLGYVSTLSLVSTTQGLQTGYATAGFLSTPNLTSTVQGLGSANYVSTLSLVSTTQGVQTGYATAGFLSTPNLTSTVQGLGSAGYVSTTALGPFFSSMSTSYAVNFITSSLTFSTATGSNATISSVTANQILFGTGNGWIQAGAIQTTVLSSVQLNTNSLYANSNFFGTVSSQTALQFYGLQGNYNNTVIAEQSTGTGTQELLLFKGSSASDQVRIQTTGGFRLETGVSSRLWPTYAQPANPAVYVDINSNVGIGTASPGALLDVVGQGRFQVVSTLQLNISSINGATFGSPINSTVIGLGSAGYVSTLSLVSTTAGIIANISVTGVLSTANLTSTVQGLGSANYVSTLSLVSTTAGIIANISVTGVLSTANLTSTVQGLGSANYVSTLSLVSTTAGILNNISITGVLSTANLTSTVQGLGSAGYISSSQLISTTQGLTNYISTFIDPTELTSTVIGLGTTGFISSIGLDAKLASTTQGLGSAGYISSSQLISTVAGLNTYASSFIDTAELASSINSLGTLGYVSTLSLVSTTQGLQTGYATAGFLSTANLTSTVQGLGSANYVSTLSLVSTTQGLQTGYATAGFLSTPNLTSTVQGLGSANYVSTLSLVSTTQGLQTGYTTAGFLSTANLTSTVQGLGSAGYLSTSALGPFFSSVSTSYALNFITSSLTFSTATGSNATISTVTTNQFTVGSNGGWILAGALQTVVLSSVQINTNVLYANSNFFGTVSSQTALQFYGLQGNYNNTVIAEQSTGTGTQELLLFKGSSASDQVRIQTTGGFRLETGVSSRLWPTYAQAANPALYVDINSNVGIGTASPGALLDVVGQGRFQVVSTLQLNISSINGATFGSPINSTVIGLGSAGYVSTLSLVSTTAGIIANISITGVLSTANLTSTVQGLGSANYVSTLSLVSTTAGILNNISITGVLSTANLTSTVQGLGSANYVSTLSLVSTTQGLQNSYATAGFLSTANLTSTVQGLGSANYVSTLSLVSTTQGLQTAYATAGFLSTANLTSTVAGLGTAGYVSTTALGPYFSSVSTSYALSFTTSSLIFSTATGSNATISSVTANQFTVGTNGGWLLTGALQTAILSSIQINTNLLYANSNFFGTVSSQTALQFYGLQGNYNNTVITEQSTGTGTQELLLFKGSSASDQVRIQTTGGFRLETGVSSRLWPTYAQAANPALYVDINSNVGIGTASPGALLDVVGQGRFQVVSTLQLNISSINGATFGSPINSTVIGLGSAGYVSTLSLVSTTAGIIANISITGVLSTANLTSTVQGLGSANYVSTLSLVSTTQGLQTGYATAGFLSTANLTSTVQGLGSANYVSTLSLVSTTQGLQTGYATAGFLSTPNLTSTVQGLGSANYVSSLSLVSTTQGLQTGYATAGFLSTANLTSTVAGLGTAGYVSTTALGPYFSSVSTSYALNFITSSLIFSTATGSTATISSLTVNQLTFGSGSGWVQFGAVQAVALSSIQVNTNSLYANSNFFGTVSSQTALQFYGLQGNYNNTVIAEQSTGTGTQELLLFKGSSASDQVRIQTTGGFRLETGVSSRLWPTYAQAANPALYVDINSNVGIGTASPGALLDVVGQGRFQVVSTLQLNISSINGATFGSPINSTVIGLGSAGYVSTLSLVSTTAGIIANTSIIGVISTANLTSTVQGLGSANYVSTLSLVSTTQGLQTAYATAGFLSTANLTSTVQGLGSANYVSTLSLVSTTQGLQTGYATAGFLSTPNLTSTVQGLGSANYVSTLSLVSTTQGLQTGYTTAGFLSTANLTSTVAGLGTAGYLSTSALGAYFSSVSTSYALNFITSSLTFSTATGSNATISTVTTNQLTVGSNGGWLLTGAIQTAIMSSVQINTNLLYTNSNFFGTVSSQTAVQFYGLQGNYNNTVIAEQSTGTGTQELLLFKGSSASDQVRIQTTGGFRLETGVSSRLWPTYAQPANPALYVDINSNVGIGTASPGALLDVVGQGRFQVVSTLQLNISSINGATFGSPINSTVIGLGTAGYVSSLSLVSTTQGLQRGYQTAGFISTANEVSTVVGLGSAGYVSTLSLVSTTAGILNNISITGVLSTANLTSTVQGLGSAGYVSTLSLVSTTQGLQTGYATAGFLSTPNLTSTVQGLGSANYVSTLSLVSTTQGLQTGYATAGFLSTPNLTSTVAGLGTAGYLSTTALGAYFSSVSTSYALNFITSSLTFSTATGSNATISTVTTNQVGIGSNGGWLQTGALQAIAVSSIQLNTNVLYANSNFFGTVSSQTALQFYGLQGNYNNTVIAEQSTGTGTQELLLFKGSSASDQVRIQTTGGFRLETGVSSRLWPTYAQPANPAVYVDINSNVGIGTASPAALLDVVGQGRFQVVSTLQLNISSINGATFGSPINSTVIGLGSAGYLSSSALGPYFSSVSTSYALKFITSSITASSITTSSFSTFQGAASTFTLDILQFATGTGWLGMGPIQPYAVSTIVTNTSTLCVGMATSVFPFDVGSMAHMSSLMLGGSALSTANAYSLAVFGDAAKTTGTSWTAISDKRIKDNIAEADYTICYNDIKKLPLRRYTYSSSMIETYSLKDKRVLGFIAQEVSTIQPKSITLAPILNIDDAMWLNTEQVFFSLYGTVKKVLFDKEILESTTKSLVTLNTNLTQRVSTLEGLVVRSLGGNV